MKTPQIAPIAGMTPLGARKPAPTLGELLGVEMIETEAGTALPNNAMPTKFRVGFTYTDRASSDWDTIYSFKIVARTDKTLTIEENGKTYKRGVYLYEGTEKCRPHGRYSMCAVISADRRGEG